MSNNKHPFKTDISVLMLFFCRADHFAQVFAEVKKARPARLFLYQDGPRNEKDMPGIEACREICSDENIDWECEVHRNYQERNYGCDPSGFMSHRWAFSLTDKCIVLEDDVVPSQSFFPFCKEMLDRYENDERVTMVAGFNTDETTVDLTPRPLRGRGSQGDNGDEGVSYFFTSVFSIWGWASWSRVVNNWDPEYKFLDNPEQVKYLEELVARRRYRSDFMQMCRDHKAAGKPFFESIFWSYMLLHNGLAIMPVRNMINNVGLDGGTHFSTSLQTTPRRLRRIFTMVRQDIEFPLTHPKEVAEYMPYKDHFYRAWAWGHPWIKVGRSFEELFLNLRYGNFGTIFKAIRNRIDKTLGRNKHG